MLAFSSAMEKSLFHSRFTGERVNQLGGNYRNGKPLSSDLRKKVIEMSLNGVRPCEISRRLKVTHGCISKLLSKFYKTGSMNPGHGTAGRPRVVTPRIEEHIERYRKEQPGIFSWEIREYLLRDNVCNQSNLPSLSSISRLVKNKIKHKVKCVEPEKSKSSLSFTIGNILSNSFHKPLHMDTTHQAVYSSHYDRHPETLSPVWAHTSYRYHGEEDEYYRHKTSDNRKRRVRFSDNELEFMKKSFAINPYPSHEERDRLSKMMGVDEARIQVWFSNRRAKVKRHHFDYQCDRLSPDAPLQSSSCQSFMHCNHFYKEPSSIPVTACNGPSRLFFPPGYRPSD